MDAQQTSAVTYNNWANADAAQMRNAQKHPTPGVEKNAALLAAAHEKLDKPRSGKDGVDAGPAPPAGDQATLAPSKRDDPKQGLRPQPRDYSELQKTHDRVAAADLATAPLSQERLQGMLAHFDELRRTHNITPSAPEKRERDGLTRLQTEHGVQLDQKHAPQPDARQQQERKFMDHQHLAEQVGVQGRWMAQHLRKQQVPGAEAIEQDGRRAFQTGRLMHGQRQNIDHGIDRGRDAARVVREQDQQKQKDLKEAARTGKPLTSDQVANAPLEARLTKERWDRAEARRDSSRGTRAHQQGGKPGTTADQAGAPDSR
jgi:hypothetical protein